MALKLSLRSRETGNELGSLEATEDGVIPSNDYAARLLAMFERLNKDQTETSETLLRRLHERFRRDAQIYIVATPLESHRANDRRDELLRSYLKVLGWKLVDDRGGDVEQLADGRYVVRFGPPRYLAPRDADQPGSEVSFDDAVRLAKLPTDPEALAGWAKPWKENWEVKIRDGYELFVTPEVRKQAGLTQLHLRGCLRDSGIPVELGPAFGVEVHGRVWRPAPREKPWDAWDRLVVERLQEELKACVLRHLGPAVSFTQPTAVGLEVHLVDSPSSSILVKGSRVLRNGEQITYMFGNMLRTGEPGRIWEAVQRVVMWTEPVNITEVEVSTPREPVIISKLGVSTPREPVNITKVEVSTPLVDIHRDFAFPLERVSLADALTASNRLTSEKRNVAFGCWVVLTADDVELELSPLKHAHSALLLPFRVVAEQQLRAAIQIDADTEPAPLYVEPGSYGPAANEAWALALVGAAALLCRDEASGGGPMGSWDSALEPTPETESLLNSAVVGHRRHLNDGQSASRAARERAHALGIALGPDQTWVRPHFRGLQDQPVLHFRWNLNDATTRRQSGAAASRFAIHPVG
jgi:hypothetical protein